MDSIENFDSIDSFDFTSSLKLSNFDLNSLSLTNLSLKQIEDEKSIHSNAIKPNLLTISIISCDSSSFSSPPDEKYEESPDMIKILNKLGLIAFEAVRSKKMKPIHSVNKDKISIAKFHGILQELGLTLNDDEINLLDSRYLASSTKKGFYIDFEAFTRDFKRIGKLLYDRYSKNKMRWRQTSRTINLLGLKCFFFLF
jgi:hypothetical protein